MSSLRVHLPSTSSAGASDRSTLVTALEEAKPFEPGSGLRDGCRHAVARSELGDDSGELRRARRAEARGRRRRRRVRCTSPSLR